MGSLAMNPYILQLCSGVEASNADQMIAELLKFNFAKAFTCTYGATTGFVVLGLLVYAPVSLALYIRTGDVRLPVVLTLLTGGAIIPQIASPGVAVIGFTVLVAGAGALTLLYYRYSR